MITRRDNWSLPIAAEKHKQDILSLTSERIDSLKKRWNAKKCVEYLTSSRDIEAMHLWLSLEDLRRYWKGDKRLVQMTDDYPIVSPLIRYLFFKAFQEKWMSNGLQIQWNDYHPLEGGFLFSDFKLQKGNIVEYQEHLLVCREIRKDFYYPWIFERVTWPETLRQDGIPLVFLDNEIPVSSLKLVDRRDFLMYVNQTKNFMLFTSLMKGEAVS